MSRFPLFAFVSLFVFFCTSVAFAQEQPPRQMKSPPKGSTSPPAIKSMPPMQATAASNIKDAKVITRIQLQAAEKAKINTANKALITQNFGVRGQQSRAVQSHAEVLEKVGNKYLVESILIFQDKNTYTATAAMMKYEVEGDRYTLREKIDNYAPRVTAMKKVGTVDTDTLKMKTALLKDLKISLPQGVGPKALANTPCDDISSAVTATNDVYNIFRDAFGSADRKIGAASTKSALLDVLRTSTRLVA